MSYSGMSSDDSDQSCPEASECHQIEKKAVTSERAGREIDWQTSTWTRYKTGSQIKPEKCDANFIVPKSAAENGVALSISGYGSRKDYRKGAYCALEPSPNEVKNEQIQAAGSGYVGSNPWIYPTK